MVSLEVAAAQTFECADDDFCQAQMPALPVIMEIRPTTTAGCIRKTSCNASDAGELRRLGLPACTLYTECESVYNDASGRHIIHTGVLFDGARPVAL